MEAAIIALFMGGEDTFNNIRENLHGHMCFQVTCPSSPQILATAFRNQDRGKVS